MSADFDQIKGLIERANKIWKSSLKSPYFSCTFDEASECVYLRFNISFLDVEKSLEFSEKLSEMTGLVFGPGANFIQRPAPHGKIVTTMENCAFSSLYVGDDTGIKTFEKALECLEKHQDDITALAETYVTSKHQGALRNLDQVGRLFGK